jgi:CRP-like cAMP-binding protein
MSSTLTTLPVSFPTLASVTTQFSARSSLPLNSDYLWQIESGFVRTLTWLEDGTTVVLGIWGAGETVAKRLAHSERCQLECMTKVEATLVPIAQLPNYADLLLEQVYQLETLMQIRSYKRVDMMLIQLLSWLAERYGKNTQQGRVVDLRLTHLDMAEAIGTTRVTVTRVLGQLEQQGVIAFLPLKRIVLHQDELWHYEI